MGETQETRPFYLVDPLSANLALGGARRGAGAPGACPVKSTNLSPVDQSTSSTPPGGTEGLLGKKACLACLSAKGP